MPPESPLSLHHASKISMKSRNLHTLLAAMKPAYKDRGFLRTS